MRLPHLPAFPCCPLCALPVLQYENLTGAGMKTALRGIKRFMDLDAKFPSDDLGLKNSRRQDHVSLGGAAPAWGGRRGVVYFGVVVVFSGVGGQQMWWQCSVF
jgi:hypothetical protein